MTIRAPVEQSDVRLVPLSVDFPAYRRRVVFQCYKWDPQVGDVGTIADHACVLSASTAAQLNAFAEALARETRQLEDALAERPDLYGELGLGPKFKPLLSGIRVPEDQSVRVMRFDFHPTTQGWAISEVNSDVPGGFAEASRLPKLAAAHVPGARPAGDAGAAVVAAVNARLDAKGCIVFVHATSYADDRQVMQFLADQFSNAGYRCALAAPDHIRWQDGHATSVLESLRGAIDGIVRFFPAEWLPALPRDCGWRGYFRNRTLASNPAQALLSQSKRLPLLWDRLGVPVPVWRALLPETCDPRDASWRDDADWLVKPAFGRVGEGLAWRGGVSSNTWRRTRWTAGLRPRQWVAQRRFRSLPLRSADGLRHLCIGVFTVDGKAAGFYGRLSARTTIEKHAQDVAVLVREETTCPRC
jgi:glutathionylspermidine synthase